MLRSSTILTVATAASFLFFSHTVTAGFNDFLQNLKKDVSAAVDGISKKPKDQPQETNQTHELNSTVPQSTAGSGLTRQENRELQQLLYNAGYDPGPVDGMPGTKTKLAIQKYQQAKGLKADGEPSRNLLVALRKETEQKPAYRGKEKASASKGTNIKPFGIPLGEIFNEKDYVKVFPRQYPTSQGLRLIYVHPKNPHPAFNGYGVKISNNDTIVQVDALAADDRTEYAIGKLKVYSNSEACFETAKVISQALQKKYGGSVKNEFSGRGRTGESEYKFEDDRFFIFGGLRCKYNTPRSGYGLHYRDLRALEHHKRNASALGKRESSSMKKHNNAF